MDHPHRTSRASERASEAAWIAELGWLRRVCRALVREEALADDLSQDVWVDAVRQRPELEGPRLRGWLGTVARRRASKLLRRERGARDSEALWFKDRSASESEDLPEDRLVLHRQLMDVIDAMDEADREAIVAYFFEGLDTAELARRTGVPEGTLRQRRRRALTRLRKRLNEEDPRWSQWLPALAFAGSGRWSASTPAFATLVPLATLTVMWKPVIALALVLLTAAAWWIGPHRTGELSPVLTIARSETAALQAVRPAAAKDAEVLALADGSRDRKGLLDDEDHASAPIDYLRVVDERGDAVPKVAGVWIDSERDIAPLEFDSSGRAPRPSAMGGVATLAAPGFLEVEASVAAPDGTSETLITLRRARTLSLQLILGDEPLDRATCFFDGTQADRTTIMEGLALRSLESFWKPLQSVRVARDLVSSASGVLKITETPAPGPMRITLPDWLLGKSVTAPMELADNASVLIVPQDCFDPRAGADWQLALLEEPLVAEGRFVWDDDKTPLRGRLTIFRRSPGYVDGVYRANIDADGSFSFSATTRGAYRDGKNFAVNRGEYVLSVRDEPTQETASLTISMASVLEEPSLGTIEIPRPQEVTIHVIERDSAGSSTPVRAAVTTRRSRGCTGPDGVASVIVDSQEAIWVQGESHSLAQIPPSRIAGAPPGEAIVVEVPRAPCLNILFESDASAVGTEIMLESEHTLFQPATVLDDEASAPVPIEWRVPSIQHPLGIQIGRFGEGLQRVWILPDGTSPIRVAGLTHEAPITVSWVDELSQKIASTVVDLDEDRTVHFGSEVTACLTVRAVLRGTNTPVAATVEIEECKAEGQLVRPLIAGYTTFDTLLPGTYRITVRAMVGGAEVSSTTRFELDESEEEALFEF
ncbi:RNA polymerase sigma factor [Planctomycetes bacterium Poly30]|uniref:RNA polymerase sigma factor n=1 Tax=Saltatorellus ferox TaxID=2528018 RepID=A0A518EVM7_9BACT|nr:RNA polymerase sigma factor [Planctomycetes bacterium Poly30]